MDVLIIILEIIDKLGKTYKAARNENRSHSSLLYMLGIGT
jgi:hypothetical protein